MRQKVLIVEDEIELAELLAAHLANWGYEPTLMHEGTGVTDWVREHRPDLILLDLMLSRDTNLIPIVMVTALADPADRSRGLEVGANHYLAKPFSAAALQAAIASAVARVEDLTRSGTQGEIHFRLKSETQHLDDLNQMLGSMFLFSGLTQQQVKQLATAVRELGTNAIEWGHRKQKERIVDVVYRIDPEKVTIVIRDSGPGFNPKQLPHAACEDDPIAHMEVRESLGLREGGFGIMMSRGLVDQMSYNEAGNEVTLVKFFPARAHLKPDADRMANV
jgi:CheY-like chemotaxis protein/anti-sigma regulatory factor (Ser/Thr protein kinase)